MLSTDAARIALNLVFAFGQVAASFLLFPDGFRTASGPVPVAGPTPLVPAGYAFIIWAPIYLGCIAYAVFQALPQNWTSPLFREIGWLTAMTFAACVLWLIAARNGPIWLTGPLFILLLLPLAGALTIAARSSLIVSIRDYWLVLAPVALYAGWVTVAFFANISELSADYGFGRFGLSLESWTLILLALALVTASVILWLGRGNPVYTAAVIWALAGVAVAQFYRPDGSEIVAGVCGLGALAVMSAAYAFADS